MFVVFWGIWVFLNIKYMYIKCIIILFMCFVLSFDEERKKERKEGGREGERREREKRIVVILVFLDK